jgi:hypothetical protein
MPAVRCAELVELVTEWMEGALDDATLASVEEHLVICPPCSEYVAQIRLTTTSMRDVAAEVPPPAAREELLRLFRAEHASE